MNHSTSLSYHYLIDFIYEVEIKVRIDMMEQFIVVLDFELFVIRRSQCSQ